MIDEECSVPLTAAALHDLVGPANQMRSMADLILKKHRGALDDDTETLFGFLIESSERLQNLLSGLRTYMRIIEQQGTYCDFEASAILDGALATIRGEIEDTGALVTSDSLPTVYGDPNQIGYIFSALVENAIKFHGECAPQVHVTAVLDRTDWRFSVTDNGIGLDPRHHESIFGVFKRIHRDRYPGAGIGLALARRIVQQHGGRIWVESSPGNGATFFFTLPAAN